MVYCNFYKLINIMINIVKGELEKLLVAENDHGPHLSYEEITTVRRNLATQGVDVDNEAIRLLAAFLIRIFLSIYFS